ncbi:hypothetical protein [Desulfofustis phage LS06-2018-MD01]|jgi:hypothetical protein|nr:hypothetical protein [Desulfofustis phage LS06-2018-MD01]
MNFKQIRERFLESSGRTDLVDTDTLADFGAGYYINAGQRWLDVKFIDANMEGRFFAQLPEKTYTFNIPFCRAINSVWYSDASNNTYGPLSKKTLSELKQEFPLPWRSQEPGTPLYYAPTNNMLVPNAQNFRLKGPRGYPEATTKMNVKYANVLTGGNLGINSITILPICSNIIDVEVWGLFHSNVLTEDEDTSWWSVNYPEALIRAGLREVEIDHRNTQGVEDWTRAIASLITDLVDDQAYELSVGINQMRG